MKTKQLEWGKEKWNCIQNLPFMTESISSNTCRSVIFGTEKNAVPCLKKRKKKKKKIRVITIGPLNGIITKSIIQLLM